MSFFRNHILFRKKRFRPDSIPNLGFWLESDYGITKDGSNAVSEWVARGSRGYTLSQATGANQPIWTANEFGSQAGLIFDGTNDSLERSVSNPFNGVQQFSLFSICKSQVNNNEENYYISMGDLGSADSFLWNKINLANGNSSRGGIVLSGTANVIRGNTTINDNISRSLIVESNGSAWSLRVNRTDQTITVTNGSNTGQAPGDFSTLDNITMGVVRRNTVSFLRSNIAAVLFYERQLSTAERTRVENYLIRKYGIAA